MKTKIVYLVIKTIGDLQDIISGYESYSTALSVQQDLQAKIIARGYTDFKFIIKPIEIVLSDEVCVEINL